MCIRDRAMRPDLMAKHELTEDYVSEYDNLGGALILDASGIYNLNDPELAAAFEAEENPYAILDDPRFSAGGEPLVKIVPYYMNGDTTIRIHGEETLYPPHMQHQIYHPEEFLEETPDAELMSEDGSDETGILLINDLPPEEQPEEAAAVEEEKEEEPIEGPASRLVKEEDLEQQEADTSNQMEYPSKKRYRMYVPYDNQFPAKMAGEEYSASRCV